MHKAKLITVGVLALVVLVIGLQNTQQVDTRLLFVTVTMPRALLLLVTAALGFVAGVIFAASIKHRGAKPADESK